MSNEKAMKRYTVKGLDGEWEKFNSVMYNGREYYLLRRTKRFQTIEALIADDNLYPVSQIRLSETKEKDWKDEIRFEIASSAVDLEGVPMPDDTISIEDMYEYGYTWQNVLPLRESKAREFMKEHMIYALFRNNKEMPVMSVQEFDKHAEEERLFGIDKAEWSLMAESESSDQTGDKSANKKPLITVDDINDFLRKDRYQVLNVERQKEINNLVETVKGVLSRNPDMTATCSVESESGLGVLPDYEILKINARQISLSDEDMNLFLSAMRAATEIEIVGTVGHRVNIILKYDKRTQLVALGK